MSRRWLALPFVVAGIAFALSALTSGGSRRSTEVCVDPGPTVSSLHAFEHAVGGKVHCVVLFDESATSWTEWAAPWFATSTRPDTNWSSFSKTAGNRLVVTVPLFPDSVESVDWRSAGAAGAYDGFARELARNLVKAGMGGAVIRIGHEANGSWSTDNVGTTPGEWAQWKQFWRHTAIAMRSVAGAHFDFDWCIAAGPRAVPFDAYYPGNDVVDSIGVDVYDRVPAGYSGNHWSYLYGEPGGVGALVRFARAHHKRIAIPEWGLEPAGTYDNSAPDPSFTRGIAQLVKHNDVELQAYFYRLAEAQALLSDHASLRLYREELLG